MNVTESDNERGASGESDPSPWTVLHQPPTSSWPQGQCASLRSPPAPANSQWCDTPSVHPSRGAGPCQSVCPTVPAARSSSALAPSSLRQGTSSQETPLLGPTAHLQMVQVKCWWSSLVPRLICHFWGEEKDRAQSGPRTGRACMESFRFISSSAE